MRQQSEPDRWEKILICHQMQFNSVLRFFYPDITAAGREGKEVAAQEDPGKGEHLNWAQFPPHKLQNHSCVLS